METGELGEFELLSNGSEGWGTMATNFSAPSRGYRVSHSPVDYITMAVLGAAFVVGAPINLAIFFRLSERAESLGKAERLKFQLIQADLLVLFVYAVSKVCWHVTWEWRGGAVLCKIVEFGHELSFQLSSIVLAAIGLDRSLLILRPYTPMEKAEKRVSWLVRGGWIYAFLCSLPNFYWFTLVTIPGTHTQQCAHKSMIWKANGIHDRLSESLELSTHVFHLVTVFWLPFAIILVSYTLIGTSVWRHYRGLSSVLEFHVALASSSDSSSYLSTGRRLSAQMTEKLGCLLLPCLQRRLQWGGEGRQKTKAATRTRSTVTFNVQEENIDLGPKSLPTRSFSLSSTRSSASSAYGVKPKANRKLPLRTLKITLVLITTYIICWLPYHTAVIIYYIRADTFQRHKALLKILSYFVIFTAVFNPFIYGAGGRGFCCAETKAPKQRGILKHRRLIEDPDEQRH